MNNPYEGGLPKNLDQAIEAEARKYAEEHAPKLAAAEAKRATDSILGKVREKPPTPAEYKAEYDRQYELAYAEHEATLYRAKLKELTGWVEE